MNPIIIVGIVAAVLALGCLLVILRALVGRDSGSNAGPAAMSKNLGGVATSSSSRRAEAANAFRGREGPQPGENRTAIETKKKAKKKEVLSIEDMLFRAGFFGHEEQSKFARKRLAFCLVSVGLALFFLGTAKDPLLLGIGVIVAGAYGHRLPVMALDKRIKERQEEIMFFLPLVIEQVSIGVSSSLDIGPCLSRVVQMADERDTHNVVTEYLHLALSLVKSGASLEEALKEVGHRSGSNELNHAFLALGQVAKHGGEVSRQLQELSDSVSMQREVQVDTRIKKLELKATGPVAVAFVGFMVILFSALFAQFQNAFSF